MPLLSHNLSEQNKERVSRILEVIIAYARLDFTQKTEVLGNDDILDAIGAGVNMLGEELEISTVSLREKEQLLKEVHHRVKNNLQIVSSLLKLQSENILDEKYLDLIADSRNRINSMALVHEMLYASRDLSQIGIGEYIVRLCGSISHSFSKPGCEVRFIYDIDQHLFFDVDKMIPIGLIINEIVSNSFKYAFPHSMAGEITIGLKKLQEDHVLEIRDNGVGFPEDFNVEKAGSLGIQLIHMLAEQMEGTIRIQQHLGTSYLINFA